MKFTYFDIHSHLNIAPFSENVEETVRGLRSGTVGTIVVGTGKETSTNAVRLANTYPDVLWATVGLHPTDVLEEVFDSAFFAKLAEDKKVVGIGECGLDYYRNRDEAFVALQKKVFRAHIELALYLDKALMLHVRPEKGTMTAYHEALDILEEYKKIHGEKLRGSSHFFVGDISVAKRFLDLGFALSFDGPITFTKEYDEVIKYVPIESIMCETDAPFAAPAPYRGQTNSPLYVSYIYEKIAALKGISVAFLHEQMIKNIQKVWQITGLD